MSDILFLLLPGFGIFLVGLVNIFFNRRSLILTIMSLEIMLLAVSLQFLIIDAVLGASFGQVFVLFILAVAAAETAVGLSLLVAYYRVYKNIEVRSLNLFIR